MAAPFAERPTQDPGRIQHMLSRRNLSCSSARFFWNRSDPHGPAKHFSGHPGRVKKAGNRAEERHIGRF